MGTFSGSKFESSSPKHALCLSMLKIAQWFCMSGVYCCTCCVSSDIGWGCSCCGICCVCCVAVVVLAIFELVAVSVEDVVVRLHAWHLEIAHECGSPAF